MRKLFSIETFAVIILILVLSFVLLIGSGGGGGDGGRPDPAEHVTDPIPCISMINFIVNDEIIDPFELSVGDTLTIQGYFSDETLDINEMVLRYYNDDNDFLEQKNFLIPPVQTTFFTYDFSNDSYVILLESGFYRLDCYLLDKEGNRSEIFEYDFLVRQ